MCAVLLSVTTEFHVRCLLRWSAISLCRNLPFRHWHTLLITLVAVQELARELLWPELLVMLLSAFLHDLVPTLGPKLCQKIRQRISTDDPRRVHGAPSSPEALLGIILASNKFVDGSWRNAIDFYIILPDHRSRLARNPMSRICKKAANI